MTVGENETVPVGKRISVDGGERATVLFEGKVGDTGGTWLGVEWDNPTRGKHDGSHKGVRYFTPRNAEAPNCCSFLRHAKVCWGRNVLEGVKERYGRVEGGTGGVEDEVVDELQKAIGAPFVQVVGFDKVNSEQSQFDKLRSVSLREQGITDDWVELATTLPRMQELDLSENLLISWDRLGQLLGQVQLRVLYVSYNILPPPVSDFPVHQFSHLRHLVLGGLGYTWANVEAVAGDLPNLHTLQVHRNNVAQIQVGDSKFLKLIELDLDFNLLSDWGEVNHLDAIPNLTNLRVNTNALTSVDATHGSFKQLRSLQLSDNKIESWRAVASLSLLGVTDFRFRGCPLHKKEKDEETSRQTTIAMAASIKILNGSTVSDKERRWAEIDYLKMNGQQYLKIKALADGEKRDAAMADFLVDHPRFPEIVKKYGEPEEGEVKEIETTLKASLIPVTIRCPDVSDPVADVVKKLPINMTVIKLRSLLHRLYRKQSNGAELRVTLRSSRNPEVEQEFDNEMRELKYYSVEEGDVLLVRW